MNRGLKILAAVLGLTALALPVLVAEGAATEGWQSEFEVGVNLLQSSYSNNWNGGDKGSIVWAGLFNGRLEKQLSEGTNWRNTLKAAFGQTHKQERDAEGRLFWQKPDKTEDAIDFESLFRFTTGSGWDPFVSATFTSMFQDQSDPLGRSLSLNPLKFKESAGMSRKLIDKENEVLMTRLGVAFVQNSRQFFVNPDPADLETYSESSTEGAAEWITEYKTKVLDGRVDWESKLLVSMPFVYSGKSALEDDLAGVPSDYGDLPDDLADYTTAVDVDWTNAFGASITKVISVKLFVRWVYDKYDNSVKPVVDDGGALTNVAEVQQAIRKAGQFKQTLALGLSYKF